MTVVSKVLNDGTIVLVDKEDEPYLRMGEWKGVKQGKNVYVYLVFKGKPGRSFHRQLMSARQGEIVDHIDGNTLNNSKSNLRKVTASQNSTNRPKNKNNTTGFKGVRQRPDGRFEAKIRKAGKDYYLGVFTTAENAAMAYDDASIELHKEHGRLNFEENQ